MFAYLSIFVVTFSVLSNYGRYEFDKSLSHDVSVQTAPMMSDIMTDASKDVRGIVKYI